MSFDEVAIRVTNLSKSYQIYSQPNDRLKQMIYPKLRLLYRGEQKNYYNEYYAITDLSFEIKKGETVGIIGRNGAGKSTLLQLICGTVTASAGDIEVNGKIAALLELGTGFNPEFTGRENVYMNATILGLTEEEINERFGDITEFADIGDYIDLPVKTYSNGMYLRLAFSVIAHVDADILVIDEALAVGDIVFTQKCMRFLRKFQENGTVLFVSHDTSSVINLCESAIWLDNGRITLYAPAREVTDKYLRANLKELYGSNINLEAIDSEEVNVDLNDNSESSKPDTKVHIFESIAHSDGWETGAARIEEIFFIDKNNQPVTLLSGGERVCLVVRATAINEIYSPILGFFVKDKLGQSLFGEHTFTYVKQPLRLSPGESCEARFYYDMPMLPNGDYSMTVSIAEGTPEEHVQHHWIHDALLFKVESTKLRYGLVGIEFQSVRFNIFTE